MKRILLILLCALAPAFALAQTTTLAVDTIVKCVATDVAAATVTIHWPTASPDSLVSQLRRDIEEELAMASATVTVNENGDTTAIDAPCYGGPADDADSLARFYAAELHQMLLRDTLGIPDAPQLVHDINIEKTWENSDYVTMTVTQYINLGGAHGMTTVQGLSYDKASGEKVALFLDPARAKDPALQAMLRSGLLEWFHGDGGLEGFELEDLLFLDDPSVIPLPVSDPWLTERGVKLLWQQYEIGPYAIGMPEVTLPYETLKPYLLGE